MNMLKDTTFIKRCGLQRVVKCWKTSRLLDAYFWKFWQSWTTRKIELKIELRYYLNCAYLRRSTVLGSGYRSILGKMYSHYMFSVKHASTWYHRYILKQETGIGNSHLIESFRASVVPTIT